MEEVFKSLKTNGQNNLDGIVQWMKDAKIIDGKTVTEEKVRKVFDDAKGDIEEDQFKAGMDKLGKDTKGGIELLVSKFNSTGKAVEEAFKKLKREGKDNVDNLIQWMKDSKIIDTAKESEERARQLLAEAKDKQHVELERFQQTVKKMAGDTETKLMSLANTVAEQGPRLMGAFQAASSAFKDAMNK